MLASWYFPNIKGAPEIRILLSSSSRQTWKPRGTNTSHGPGKKDECSLNLAGFPGKAHCYHTMLEDGIGPGRAKPGGFSVSMWRYSGDQVLPLHMDIYEDIVSILGPP